MRESQTPSAGCGTGNPPRRPGIGGGSDPFRVPCLVRRGPGVGGSAFRVPAFLLASLLPFAASQPLSAADPPAAPALPFKQGEKLTYHFHWGIFMVGRGTFEVTEVRPDGTCVFTVTVRSNDLISAIYPVEDVITSEYDSRRGRATRFEQNRSEGDDRVWEETLFFHDAEWASTTDRNTGEVKWFRIPRDAVQDKLSTIYHMRTLGWKDRESGSVLLGNDKENYKVNMKKTGTEKLEPDDFDEIPTFKVEPDTEYLSGFVKKGKMQVWVSDDAFRVPVRVESGLSVGTVSAILVKVEGVEGWPYNPKD